VTYILFISKFEPMNTSEFNQAATSFVVPVFPSDSSTYSIRWFMPGEEEALCGHGTLAAGHVLSSHPATAGVTSFTFNSQSGLLKAVKSEDGLLELDFPADDLAVVEGEERVEVEKAISKVTRGTGHVKQVYRGRLDLVVELVSSDSAPLADRLASLDVDHSPLVGLSARGVHVGLLIRYLAMAVRPRRGLDHRNR
jgi:predicted PhzF superfamily epimerase YddE/YHI9